MLEDTQKTRENDPKIIPPQIGHNSHVLHFAWSHGAIAGQSFRCLRPNSPNPIVMLRRKFNSPRSEFATQNAKNKHTIAPKRASIQKERNKKEGAATSAFHTLVSFYGYGAGAINLID